LSDYLLGHDDREWDRLTEQHTLWGPALLATLAEAGLGRGASVLEVGCGAGDLLADLTTLVGPEGVVAGIERDPIAAERAGARVPRATVTVGDLRTSDLGGPWDAVVARWVLSFVPEVPLAVERMVGALRPGGLFVVEDYVHDGFLVWPRHPAIDRVIAAFRAAYKHRGGDLWVGASLPGWLATLGIEATARPEIRAGRPGEPVWRWVERFLHEHIDTVVEDGHLTPDERSAFEQAWKAQAALQEAILFTPMQVTVWGRAGSRPRDR
jgi:SAM-dependent methyltransferase